MFKSSYSNHYRRGLMQLLGVLDFQSSNDAHKPVIDALALIERHKDSTTQYLPLGETIPLDGVVHKGWMEFAVHTPLKGPQRVVRTVYEACVFQALRERLRCKEIWVVGADRWRNPDEDLPDDFDLRRAEYYDKLNKPRDAADFTAQLKKEMREALTALDTALPKLPWVTISAKYRSGAIRFTDPEPQPEPKNLRKLKKAIRKKWGPVALIDILKEAALRTGMLKALAPVGTREAIDEAKLLERLLLIAYAYGTNSGISSVAAERARPLGGGPALHRPPLLHSPRPEGRSASRSQAPPSPPARRPCGARAPPPSPRTPPTSRRGTATSSPSGTLGTGGRGVFGVLAHRERFDGHSQPASQLHRLRGRRRDRGHVAARHHDEG
ncbi:hypothetical protein GCM10020000_82370 [Streptomyces olivoverticillatus]